MRYRRRGRKRVTDRFLEKLRKPYPRAQNQEAGGDGYAPLGVIIMIDR